MPRDVDLDQRLADIAAATVDVAEREGTHAVTIRSVAKQLGGSTTLVTNYIPSRAGLILNALDHARTRWRTELDELLASRRPEDQLSAVLDWSLSAEGDDSVINSLIIEIVANAAVEPTLRAALQRESLALHELLRSAADASGYVDPIGVADALYVLVRGVTFATLEDPAGWPDPRVRATIDRVLERMPRRL